MVAVTGSLQRADRRLRRPTTHVTQMRSRPSVKPTPRRVVEEVELFALGRELLLAKFRPERLDEPLVVEARLPERRRPVPLSK